MNNFRMGTRQKNAIAMLRHMSRVSLSLHPTPLISPPLPRHLFKIAKFQLLLLLSSNHPPQRLAKGPKCDYSASFFLFFPLPFATGPFPCISCARLSCILHAQYVQLASLLRTYINERREGRGEKMSSSSEKSSLRACSTQYFPHTHKNPHPSQKQNSHPPIPSHPPSRSGEEYVEHFSSRPMIPTLLPLPSLGLLLPSLPIPHPSTFIPPAQKAGRRMGGQK